MVSKISVCPNLCLSELLIVRTSIFSKNLYLSKLKGGKLDSEAFYDGSRECFDASKEILKPEGEQGAAEGGPEASATKMQENVKFDIF